MSAQRKTAGLSVIAVCIQVAIKLITGLATGSLGLLAEAAHSGSDLVAALLTLFAVGVSERPADRGHPYGHGKAEHLAALAEGTFLVAASLFIAVSAIGRLTSHTSSVEAHWYAFIVLGAVLTIDATRVIISRRGAREYHSPALAANALHFASDFAGSLAVLIGLALTGAGYPAADSVAALLVASLVLVGAGRLMRTNVHTLMDRAPADASERARRAVERATPDVELRRLRMREAAGRHFADVVIGVPPSAQVGQGHALADEVEQAIEQAVPGSDVVVHVEPFEAHPSVRERALAAALRVPDVREIHNLEVLETQGQTEVSLHLKLPDDMDLDRAHLISHQVEQTIMDSVPEVKSVQTHIEPLAKPSGGTAPPADEVSAETVGLRRIVSAHTGSEPREVRFVHTDRGLVAFLTMAVGSESSLRHAHGLASEIEEEVRARFPRIAEVIVHTEP